MDAEDGPEASPATQLTRRLRDAASQRLQEQRDDERAEGEQGLADLTALNNELATLQRALAASNAELVALNEWKIRFLAMVAHDLRGPLTAIRGFAELLEMTLQGVLDDGQVDMFKQILGSSDRLGRMIDELMDASALSAGKFVMDFTQGVAVPDLVRTAISTHQPSADYKGITVEPVIAADLPGLEHADPNKLVQVLSNLVSNAIKYSHRGTAVRVVARTDGPNVILEVADEGQGMSEDDIAILFTPYGTTSVKSTAGETSTGLGLAIVQAIVEGHGGSIEVTSAPGEGSTFRVTIPVVNPVAPEPAEEGSAA